MREKHGTVWATGVNFKNFPTVSTQTAEAGRPVTATSDDEPLLLTNCSGLDLNGYTLNGSPLNASAFGEVAHDGRYTVVYTDKGA